MAQVPEKVLSWLYSVLHEYRDPQQTYSDAVRSLSAYPSLLTRTEVYTYENGVSALLLTIAGTIPATFRGTTYRFPIKLWIPHAYPQEAPIAYVVPGKDMLVRPGQHVGVDGRIYHPYLRDWSRMWDRANMTEFLGILQQVFEKEPPVISKAQQQQYQRPLGANPQQMPAGTPTPPQPPPKQRVGSREPAEMSGVNTPPLRPPKPGEEYAGSARDVSRDGPPLPPLPPEAVQSPPLAMSPQNQRRFSQPQGQPSQSPPVQQPNYQNGRPMGPPSIPSQYQQMPTRQQFRAIQDRSPVSPVSPVPRTNSGPTPYLQPYAQSQAQAQTQQPAYAMANAQQPPQPQPFQQQPQAQQAQQQRPLHPGQPAQLVQYQRAYAQNPPQPYPPPQFMPNAPATQQPPQPNRPPPVDLLSDPFEIALPGSSAMATSPPPAPPIPPNPEKEHLIQAISTSLQQQVQEKVNQNLSAIAPLQAQQHALRSAHERLEAEIRQMEQLDQTLSNNEAILHGSIRDCDQTIATAKSKTQPPIDEVLLAPTMVANQLWTLCAEEAACREAMYVLQKAVDRGRISGNDFVRQMRGLGRECFLKMALARKCAKGMGLDMPRWN